MLVKNVLIVPVPVFDSALELHTLVCERSDLIGYWQCCVKNYVFEATFIWLEWIIEFSCFILFLSIRSSFAKLVQIKCAFLCKCVFVLHVCFSVSHNFFCLFISISFVCEHTQSQAPLPSVQLAVSVLQDVLQYSSQLPELAREVGLNSILGILTSLLGLKSEVSTCLLLRLFSWRIKGMQKCRW